MGPFILYFLFLGAVRSSEPALLASDRVQSRRLHRCHTDVRPGRQPVRAGYQTGADPQPSEDTGHLEQPEEGTASL